MDFEAANAMFDEVVGFLNECGGIYEGMTYATQENIIVSLVAGQYVYEPGQYFACFFKVHNHDVEGLKDGIRPLDVFTGNVVYIAELACKRGLLAKTIKAVRDGVAGCTGGAFWHRPAKGNKLYFFPSQKGTEVGHG